MSALSPLRNIWGKTWQNYSPSSGLELGVALGVLLSLVPAITAENVEL